MGNKVIIPGVGDELLDEYVELTYLSKYEIVYLLKRFYALGPTQIDRCYDFRFSQQEVVEKFPILKFNPFVDRIFHVFSSRSDNRFSIEDMLDLASVMSEDCPVKVKAAWAFRIFDLDDDKVIDENDICEIIDRLTWDRTDINKVIDNEDKLKIAQILLKEMDLQEVGSFGPADFLHLISKMPEFKSAFYFNL